MATIGSLIVDLILQSASFNAEMAKSAKVVEANTGRMQRSLAGIEGGVVRATKALKALGAAAAVSAAARAIYRLGENAVQTGDEIGEAASKLGIGAEELQRFRFAAAQTDVDTVSLNNALKQFQKTIATGKAPYTTFDAVIAKIAEAKTQTEKVAIGFQYFGKQYQAALLIAAQGADTFKKSMDSAYVISQQNIRVASDLDNKFRELSSAITAGFNEGFLTGFAGALSDTGTNLQDVNKAMIVLGQQMGRVAGTTLNLLEKVAKFISDHPQLMQFAFGLNPFAKPEGPKLPPLDQGEMIGGLDAGSAAAEKQKAEAAAAEALAAKTKAAADATKALNEQRQLAKTLIEQTQTPNEQYAAALDKIKAAQLTGADATRAHTAATAVLVGSYLDLAGQVTGVLGQVFKDSKAVAVAQAVINTAQAITATLAQYGATPWGLSLAAVAAASGAAQIATILSTQPGSSKKPAAGASAAKTTGSQTNGEGFSRSPRQAVTINLMGQGGFTRDQVRQLADELNGLVADGATIRTA